MVKSSDRVVSVLEKMMNDVAATSDCAAATAALQANQAAVQGIQLEANNLEQVWGAAPADAQAWFKATYLVRLNRARNAIRPVILTCRSDAAFKAAFDRVNTSPP